MHVITIRFSDDDRDQWPWGADPRNLGLLQWRQRKVRASPKHFLLRVILDATPFRLVRKALKPDGDMKEIETAIAAAKTAVEGNDPEAMKAKAQELAERCQSSNYKECE